MLAVFCNDDDKPFNIHQQLLLRNTRNLHLNHPQNGSSAVEIDSPSYLFQQFAQWLYHDISFADMLDGQEAIGHVELIDILELHALGRQVGCFDFMDFVLDGVIDILSADCTFCPYVFMKAMTKEFPPWSGGWKLAIDVLLQ